MDNKPMSDMKEPIGYGAHFNPNVDPIWSQCLEIFRSRVNTQSFKTWFEPIVPFKTDEGKFFIRVPSQFFSEWLEEHYFSLISEALTQVTGRELALEYNIAPDDRDNSPARSSEEPQLRQ